MKRFLYVVFAIGCAGQPGVDLSSRDPRCIAACPETMPQYDGVGPVCDTASRVQCLDECEARIKGLPTVCQNCLVDNASFGPSDLVVNSMSCTVTSTSSTCTLTSDFGMCSYSGDDHAAYLACLQKVDPRRTVACEGQFRPTTECASVCP
jgi:hypothetical protein